MQSAPATKEDRIGFLKKFRTVMCASYKKGQVCTFFKQCHFAHGPKELRRSPAVYKYSPELCPEAKNSEMCSHGLECPFSRNLTESLYHPERYKTRVCEQWQRGECLRGEACAFVHDHHAFGISSDIGLSASQGPLSHPPPSCQRPAQASDARWSAETLRAKPSEWSSPSSDSSLRFDGFLQPLVEVERAMHPPRSVSFGSPAPSQLGEMNFYMDAINGESGLSSQFLNNVAPRYASALLNSSAGNLFWGVDASTGAVTGVPLSDAQSQLLTQHINSMIAKLQPPPPPSAVQLSCIPVVGGHRPDLTLVCLRVAKGCAAVHFTDDHRAFRTTPDGRIKELSGPDLKEWIQRAAEDSRSRRTTASTNSPVELSPSSSPSRDGVVRKPSWGEGFGWAAQELRPARMPWEDGESIVDFVLDDATLRSFHSRRNLPAAIA